jgi:hypothetical protein
MGKGKIDKEGQSLPEEGRALGLKRVVAVAWPGADDPCSTFLFPAA